MRIAVDAMGGDRAPGAIVAGVVEALARDDAIDVDLVGSEDAVEGALAATEIPAAIRARLRHVRSDDVAEANGSPVRDVRARPRSPVRTCIRRLRRGDVGAVVSAGDTGAIVAAAVLRLGRIEGVARPGIAVRLPSAGGGTILIDAGANLVPRPHHLVQYAVMGAELARASGCEAPRVGLLSVGTEKRKGTRLTRAVDARLAACAAKGGRYVGLVEGQDLFGDDVDVVVADGFTGNAVLKACEGLAHRVVAAGAVDRGRTELDFAATGGAPLLGVRGAVIIAHGRSDPRAVANAVLAARDVARHRLVDRIAAAVQGGSET